MDILLGLILLVAGLGLVFSGLRVFFFMLPIAGFITGFFTGAILIANLMDQGFLSTVVGWIVGIVLGLIFAAISYLYWYIGAILSAGAAGASLMSGLANAFGVDTGWILVLAALIGTAIFVIVAVMLNLPVFVVLVNTAIVGAYTVIAGLLLILNRANLDDMGYGAAHAAVDDHWFWWLVVVILAGLGIFSQLAVAAVVRVPDNRWSQARAVAAQANDTEQR